MCILNENESNPKQKTKINLQYFLQKFSRKLFVSNNANLHHELHVVATVTPSMVIIYWHSICSTAIFTWKVKIWTQNSKELHFGFKIWRKYFTGLRIWTNFSCQNFQCCFFGRRMRRILLFKDLATPHARFACPPWRSDPRLRPQTASDGLGDWI